MLPSASRQITSSVSKYWRVTISPTATSSARATLNHPNGIGNGNRSDKDRHLRVAPHGAGVESHGPRMVDLPRREALQRLFEGDPALEPGERRTQAEVDAV